MRLRNALVAVCCCLALVAGPAVAQSKKESKEAAKFRAQGEAAHDAIVKARDQLHKTLAAYDSMLAAAPKKIAGAHKKLTGEIDKTEKLVAGGKKQVTAFQTTAEGFFATWQSQLESISTESIRAASERRLQAAQQGFQGMSENLTTAREIYDPIMASLKEQTTLLNQDLSGETIEMLKADAAPGLHTQAEELFATIEAALNKESARAQEVNQILEEESAEVDMEGTEEMAGEEGMDGEEDVEGE